MRPQSSMRVAGDCVSSRKRGPKIATPAADRILALMKVNKPAAALAALLFTTTAVAAPATSGEATTNINFEHIPVRSALQLIAEQGHFNLVVSDSVKGDITLHLRGVTWEQALDVVLRMKGLGKRVDGAGAVTVTRG
jgi:type II secretory pathway component HofQ